MKTRKLISGGLVTITLVALSGAAIGMGGYKPGDDDEVVSLRDVPAAVRQTIKQHAKGGTIEKIERSTEDGKTVYEVEVEGHRGDFEFAVGRDGSFLGMDHEDADHENDDGDEEVDQPEQVFEITFADAPRSVRDTFEDRTDGAKPTKVERIVDEDVTKYEVEYARHGDTASMTMSDKGEVLEMETPVAIDRLPAAVRAEIMKDYPGATIEAAEAVQLFYYEMDVVVDGKTVEVVALATGDIEDWFSNDSENGEEDHADGDHEDEDHDKGDHEEDDDD
jgi:uncharacterized membrane protein YkoI